HRGRAGGAGSRVLAAGWAARPAALSESGSGAAPEHGPIAARDTPGDCSAGAAGTRRADCSRAGLDGRQGMGRTGSGADLWPGTGVVYPARRDVAALSDPVGLMALLSEPRGAPDR